MAASLDELTPLRIWFREPEDEERGFYALLTSGMPVHALHDGRYIVNQKQFEMLTEKGIKYEKETMPETMER